MSSEWAEKCLDHYISYLREPAEAVSWESEKGTLQILNFKNVFKDCMVFCSLGFAKFSKDTSNIYQECVFVVDNSFEEARNLFAGVLLYLGEERGGLDPGISQAGNKQLDPDFVSKYDKNGFYFTKMHALPQEFSKVDFAGNNEILMAFLISEKEHEFIQLKGPIAFEEELSKFDMDPFDISRNSIID